MEPALGNLPNAAGRFVGREALLASVVRSLGAHRLVVLTGVGGVGKTRLALEAAASAEEHFRDGVWFVDLAAVADAGAVVGAVASTLGIAPQSDIPMRETVRSALGEREVLLVLDNCEHVLDEASALAEVLCARPGGPRVLATSRERLLANGEIDVAVPPLDVHDRASAAVELFVERARAVRPNFSLDDHEGTADAAVELCRRLDGLPLGIELAAARMAGMSVVDVRDRLDDRFRLLEGRPGSPNRHRSLPELVRWSFDLLDPPEREILLQASVFVGGFVRPAFSGVWGHDDDTAVLRSLDRLVRSSLVVAEHSDGRVRYRLLETIRQFALDRLVDEGRLDDTRDRHARWFAAEVTRRWASHEGPGWRPAVDWLREELADLRAAFAWSAERDLLRASDIAAHSALVGTTADVFEPIGWAERVVDDAITADLPRLPRLLCACGLACFVGRPVVAAAHAEHALALEELGGYESCTPGMCAFVAALANVYAGRLDRYVELAARAASHAGAARAFGQAALVDGLQASGRVDEAISLLDDAVDAARSLGSPFWLAYALWIAGNTLAKVDPARALDAWEEGISVVAADGVDFFRGFLARDAARLHVRAGDVDVALAQFTSAIEAFARAGNVAQLLITVASVPELLARADAATAACTLHAAVVQLPGSTEHVPELVALGEQLHDVLGPAAATADAAGRAMNLDAAARFARLSMDELGARRGATRPRPGGLSSREVEVLRLLAAGLTTRELAARLYISPKTADRHIQNLYTKIGTSTRATATRWAVEHGLAG